MCLNKKITCASIAEPEALICSDQNINSIAVGGIDIYAESSFGGLGIYCRFIYAGNCTANVLTNNSAGAYGIIYANLFHKAIVR